MLACFDPLLGTLSRKGGGPQIITVRRGWVSSYCCSSSTRSIKMTILLLGRVFLLLCFSVTPNTENGHHTDCAENPLQPMSTGNVHDFQPLSLHSDRIHDNSFVFFHRPPRIFLPMELSTLMTMIFFIRIDQSNMSGLRLFGTMSGSFSFCPKFTANCQSWLRSKIP